MSWTLDLPLRDWVVLALLTLAESALIWLIASAFLSLGTQDSISLSPWLVAGVVVAAVLIPRALHDLGIWDAGFSAIAVVAIAASVLVSAKVTVYPDADIQNRAWLSDLGHALILDDPARRTIVWMLIFMVAAIWWRARFRGEAGADSAISLFRTGALASVVGLILHSLIDSGVTNSGTSPAIVVYFSLTLVALAVARHHREGTTTISSFAMPILLPLVAILLGALVVVGVLTSDLMGMLDIVVGPASWVLSIVFAGLVLLLTGIALLFAIPLIWLLSQLPLDPGSAESEIEPVTMGTAPEIVGRATELPDAVRYVVAGFVLFLLFAGAARFVLKLGKRLPDGETRESAGVDGSSMLDQLQSWFRGLLGQGGGAQEDPLSGLRGMTDWRHTVAIREAYQQFLSAAREAGFPRRAGVTPSMYATSSLARLSDEGARDALVSLTSAYESARYAEFPATAEQAQRATSDWTVLKSSLRSINLPVDS